MPTDKSLCDKKGHRDRLRERFLSFGGSLSDYELLELLLFAYMPRIDTKLISKNLLRTFGGLHQVAAAGVNDLIRVPGIGKNTAVQLKAIREFALRGYVAKLKDAPIFHDWASFENYAKQKLSDKKIEEFHILYLDSKYQLIEDEAHSTGTINGTAVYAREVVIHALNLGARVVVMMHNHPGGNANFSSDDINATKDVMAKLAAMDIEFFDHFLIANGLMYSIKNSHLLD
ncbi:MAG: DNA repair protein RadC [Rickettsiales bacterium]|jgi:DNA repair protein RadC|nr:DNA repair protein RadC [Rickettsiales bacterium]